MPLMISDKNMQVAFNGPDIRFVAGEPVFVRDSLVAAAEQAGARLADGKSAPDTEVKPSDDRIRAAIEQLQEDGATRAFGTDGKPKVRSIEKLLGENIDAYDRDRVWDEMND